MTRLTEAQILLRMRNGEEFVLEDNVKTDDPVEPVVEAADHGKTLRDAMDDIEQSRMKIREIAKAFPDSQAVWDKIVVALNKVLIDMRKSGAHMKTG